MNETKTEKKKTFTKWQRSGTHSVMYAISQIHSSTLCVPFQSVFFMKGGFIMPILKNKTQSSFTQISNNILRDRELSMKERGVLCTLLSFPDKWDFSIGGLSAIVPDGRDSLNKTIQNLIKAGYVRRNQIRDSRGKFAVELEVQDKRGALSLETVSGLPLRNIRNGSADTELSDTVNPQQYNNDIYNKDLYNINPSINQIEQEQTDGQTEISKEKKELMNLEKLSDRLGYSEVCRILSYPHLQQEIEECELSQYEVRMRVVEELKYRIDYKTFVLDGEETLVDAILDYMAEVVAANRSIAFGGETYDADSMGNAFYRLDYCVVQYVISQFQKYSQKHQIQNKKNYLLRMLLTARSDMETDIQADVNYDMAHWHENHLGKAGD
jgi:hypothetical protein